MLAASAAPARPCAPAGGLRDNSCTARFIHSGLVQPGLPKLRGIAPAFGGLSSQSVAACPPLPSPTSPYACPTSASTAARGRCCPGSTRSEEHTYELQSLMRSSYAVFCLNNKKKTNTRINYTLH